MSRAPLPPPEDRDSGFLLVYGAVASFPNTQAAWYRASNAILAAVPETCPEGVRFFLASDYGERVAQEMLDGHSVESQLEFRIARFRKHYAQTERTRLMENPQ